MIDLRHLERILSTVPSPSDREWLRERLEPAWRRRERQIVERDELVRQIAAQFYVDCPSAREITNRMRSDLRRLPTLAGTDNAHRAALRRLLALSSGKVLSRTTFANALAGIPSGQNSVEVSGHAIWDNGSMGKPGEFDSGKVEEVDHGA